jgi:hypothetical protein
MEFMRILGFWGFKQFFTPDFKRLNKTPAKSPKPQTRDFSYGRVLSDPKFRKENRKENTPVNPHSPDDALSFGTDGAIQI